MAKRIFSFLFCLLLIASFVPVSAEENTTSLSVISANVSGLPAFLSKYDRDVPASQKTLGGMLNAKGYDVICVQEDFQYHGQLADTMTDYPYQTYTSGGVPIGDGLNIFSKYPIYNIERVAWEKYYGVFADGSDALTPKGFIKCTIDVNGVLIDLYNVHCDAYRTEADQLVKKAQLIQLVEYIEKNSAQRPIIVTGDTNLTFHNDPLSEMHRILIVEGGFTDCWVEVKNNGNYMQEKEDQSLIQDWYNKFGGHDWGRWDSVERVLYRDGGGVRFSPTRFEYVIYTDREDEIKSLTDHRMMECVMELDLSDYEKPDAELEEPKKPSVFYGFFHGAAMLLRFLFIVIAEVFKKYTAVSVAVSAAVIFGVVMLCILIKKRRSKRKKGTEYGDLR